MKRLLFVLAMIALSGPSLYSQPVSTLWSKVEGAEKSGKFQTAADYLKILEEKALAEGDELERYYIADRLYSDLSQYNWKEANSYYPTLRDLRDSLMGDNLETSITKYKGHSREIILLYERLLRHKSQIDGSSERCGDDYLKLKSECLDLIRKHPASDYRERISNILKLMDATDLHTSSPGLSTPTDSFPLTLSVRNISSVDVSIYRLHDGVLLDNGGGKPKKFLTRNASLCSRKTIDGFRNEYNIGERKEISVDLSEPGLYGILLEAEGIDDLVQANITNVGGAFRERNGKIEIFAADLTTGKPFQNAGATLFDGLKAEKTISTGLDGFTPIDVDPKQVNRIRIESKDDSYAPLIYIHSQIKPLRKEYSPMRTGSVFLTDRAVYRPSDTIYFKMIFYESNQTEGRVVEGRKASIGLSYSNEDKEMAVLELTTGDMGSTSGSFVIPEDAKSGIYYLSVDGQVQKSVRVEKYIRPTFSIKSEPVSEAFAFGDVVRQRGILNSYSGYSVSGATVEYEINARSYMRYCYQEKVASGKVLTDNDGVFEIPFVAQRPDVALDPERPLTVSYIISMKATDPSGETQSCQSAITISDNPLYLSANLPTVNYFDGNIIVDKDCIKDFSIDCFTSNGASYPIEGKYSLLFEGKEVFNESFGTGEFFEPEWKNLPSGLYSLISTCNFRGKEIRNEKRFILMSIDDDAVPVKADYFYCPVKTENAIDFLIGTSSEDLYLECELFDNDSVLYRQPLHLKNEMKRISIPYCDSYESAVELSIFGFKNGKEIHERQLFTRPDEVEQQVSIESLRDKTTPRTEEIITIKAGPESELTISIYDTAADRLGENDLYFHPLSSYRYVSAPDIFSIVRFGSPTVYGLAKNASMAAAPMSMDYSDALVETEEAAALSNEGSSDSQNYEIREDLRELIGFFPHTKTDKEGYAELKFRTTDILSTFRILVLAHDKNLKTGYAETSFTVQKSVMVIPHLPAFATEGDRIVIHSQIVNTSATEISGKASLEIYDENGKKIGRPENIETSLLSNGQTNVSWILDVPSGCRKLKVKISFSSENASDGEIGEIEILPDSITLTEAASFILGSEHNHKYYEKQLHKEFKASHPTVEYAEYSTLDALKETLKRPEKPATDNVIDWTGQLYISLMRSLVLGIEIDEAFRSESFANIKALQDSDGGLRWFSGMSSNLPVTLYFLEKMGQLRSTGAFDPTEDEYPIIDKAIGYIDKYIEKNCQDGDCLSCCSVRSLWLDKNMNEEVMKGFDTTLEKKWNGWQKRSILEKTEMCNIMLRCKETPYWKKGMESRIRLIKESLLDYAVRNNTTGCYFPNAVMPYRGMMNNEIYAHSQLMDLFTSLGEKSVVKGLAQWLLLQKHNQAWESTAATADAVHAIFESRVDDLRFGAVYYTYETPVKKIKSSGSDLKVSKTYLRADRKSVVKEGETVSVGEKIIIRYTVSNSENRSFVKMTAKRPAALYPVEELSGYSWKGYYREVDRSESIYYWELLPEEETIVEEEFFVSQEGLFSSGPVQIESLFAPEYRGHTGFSSIESIR